MQIKETIKKVPGIHGLYLRHKERQVKAEYQSLLKSNKEIDERISVKLASGEKINMVFVCHRPAVWGALKTVYDYLSDNPIFDAKIVAIPKVNAFTKATDDEGAFEYFSAYHALNGFVNGEFIDLERLHPDFVFFQQPYNSAMPEQYQSNKVAKYAHICYVSYFAFISNLNAYDTFHDCLPRDFMRDISFYFAQNNKEMEYVKEWMKDTPNFMKYCVSGYPKYDEVKKYTAVQDADVWNMPKTENSYRVIWTPRWCTNENNSHFFDYKDKVLELCENNKNIDFVFRPHPQSWYEWERTGEFTKGQADAYKKRYNELPNACIDKNKDYLDMFYSSDCLITDMSTIIPDYFLTGKPIIYCDSHNRTNGYLQTGGYSESFYWAYNWDEVEKYLSMLLNGNDPLKGKRQAFIAKEFNFGNESSGLNIAEFLTSYCRKIHNGN